MNTCIYFDHNIGIAYSYYLINITSRMSLYRYPQPVSRVWHHATSLVMHTAVWRQVFVTSIEGMTSCDLPRVARGCYGLPRVAHGCYGLPRVTRGCLAAGTGHCHGKLMPFLWILLCMHPVYERRRYIVTSSLIGWVHTQNGLCIS